MGGGGRRGLFYGRSPEKLAELIRRSESKTADAEFSAKLAQTLGGLLSVYNGRDTELVRERLDEITKFLEGEVEDTLDLLFGGSVAKHTYVDGLSDIDSLLIVNDTELEKRRPEGTLDRITAILKDRIGDHAMVDRGQMAVTLEYKDGMRIQLLPAVRTGQGLRIPSSTGNTWSEIDADGFRQALSKRNEECSGKLVRTIKLAKAALGTLPESQRLSGYHVESLAVKAFRGYAGPKTTEEMLPAFFERAKDLVLEPIRDRTGQSVHVDDYLGKRGSQQRQSASHLLGRIAKRMRNANAGSSIPQWKDIFDVEE